MVGIIVAMTEELEAIKEYMNNTTVEIKCENEFYIGIIGKKEVILTTCGVGKVNSARTTQVLIDKYNIDYIINVGVAGSLNEKLDIGDILVGEKLVQHDFDITAVGHPKGYISKELGREFLSDKNIIEKCERIIKSDLKDINVRIGTIATGDVFCTKIAMKEELVKEFSADCVEMEGASIAQVCTLCKIPFIVIRSISDKPNGHNAGDFKKYVISSSKKFQKIIELLIKNN